MSGASVIHVVVTLFLCVLAVFGIPATDFLPCGSSKMSVDIEGPSSDLINLPSSGDEFVEIATCRDLARMRVYTDGRVALSPLTEIVENLELDVFEIDDDLKGSSTIEYCDIVPSNDYKSMITTLFNTYFGRRIDAFDPNYVMIITWDLYRNSSDERNLFQVVLSFDIDENILFIMYNYGDGLIQWADVGGSYANVGAELCGGEDGATFTLPSSGTADVSTQVLAENILHESGNVAGRVVLAVAESKLFEYVQCDSSACNAENGFCEEVNACQCKNADEYEGTTCSDPICSSGCGPGTCIAPNTCDCGSSYTGDTCDTPVCNIDCGDNGDCTGPDVCTCHEGWSGPGDACGTPVCNTVDCGDNGDCSAPNVCTCHDDWSGDMCDTFTCDDCTKMNQICVAPNDCQCVDGWSEDDCMTPICDTGTCVNGNCTGPDVCLCFDGWSSDNCTIPICDDTSACVNGDCVEPNTCECFEGYEGDLCDTVIATPSEKDEGLSSEALGGIIGGIVGLSIVMIIIVIIIIGAFCAL